MNEHTHAGLVRALRDTARITPGQPTRDVLYAAASAIDALAADLASAQQALAEARDARPRLRAGDHVLHRPSGETWVVAYQDGKHIAWCGWPEGEARAADCEVVHAATDEEHRGTLQALASLDGKRGRLARAALAAMKSEAPRE